MTDQEPQSQPADESPADDAAASAAEPAAEESPTPEQQLATAEAELAECRDRSLRLQAEMENQRKRFQREAEQLRQYAAVPLASDLLPCLDNLQRAIGAAEQTGNVEELLQGIRMVAAAFEETFKRHSIQPISADGETFDPNRHEALQQFPSPDHPAMQIIQEVERGWQLHDRVLRPSKVIVSSGPPQPAE